MGSGHCVSNPTSHRFKYLSAQYVTVGPVEPTWNPTNKPGTRVEAGNNLVYKSLDVWKCCVIAIASTEAPTAHCACRPSCIGAENLGARLGVVRDALWDLTPEMVVPRVINLVGYFSFMWENVLTWQGRHLSSGSPGGSAAGPVVAHGSARLSTQLMWFPYIMSSIKPRPAETIFSITGTIVTGQS
ncbi:hypothetical protein J6590_032825 [Homalodisca vitripennis]|nr:hypothetical protein J6590_032825 [Homalodisca vitripennis]